MTRRSPPLRRRPDLVMVRHPHHRPRLPPFIAPFPPCLGPAPERIDVSLGTPLAVPMLSSDLVHDVILRGLGHVGLVVGRARGDEGVALCEEEAEEEDGGFR
jgi:hypothetical protein